MSKFCRNVTRLLLGKTPTCKYGYIKATASVNGNDVSKIWSIGKVVSLSTTRLTFSVVIDDDSAEFVTLNLYFNLNVTDLLNLSKDNLRCVEWENFSKSLMETSIRDAALNIY